MPKLLLGESAFIKYRSRLDSCGFKAFCLPADSGLNAAVSDHADTLVFSDGETAMANADYITRLDKSVGDYIFPVPEMPSGKYPTDTVFNALRIGGLLFARSAGLAPSVKRYAEDCGLQIVNVKQGYAKCSSLALPAARAAITADEGMAKAFESAGIDTLRIRPGHILLKGCEYGFIGGASFVWEPRCCCSIADHGRYVYFFGDIRRHPDGEAITEFIKRRGYEVIALDGELTDFGGAVIL